MVSIQNTAHQARQRNQQNVRKGNPQHRGRQFKFIGAGGKPRRGEVNNPWRGQNTYGRDDDQHEAEQTRNVLHKSLRGFGRTGLSVFSQYRHKSLRKSPLGKNATEQIGKFESHKKRIGGHACAKHARNNGITNKTQYSRHHGHATDLG